MKLSNLLLASLAVASLTACTDNEDSNYSTVCYSFEFSDSSIYNENGYWSDVFNDANNALYISPALGLSHTANATSQSWTGFCPSQATETNDVSAESIIDHQWSSVTGTGAGNSNQYLVCKWSSGEDLNNIPSSPSLKIVLNASGTSTNSVIPQSVYVANTNYSYWVMKKGSSQYNAFDADGWCKVIFKGVKNNQLTGSIEQYLAKDGTIYNSWLPVDLSALGNVDYIYIQMDSSNKTTDSGVAQLNYPSYICLDNLAVTYNY